MIPVENVRYITGILLRLVNKFNRLNSKALDFGTGDLLYPSEIHIIEAIGKKTGNTVNEIAREFGVTKGAVSQVVNKLSRKGLIGKNQNPDFYKETILSLTTKGRRAFEGHEKLHQIMDEDLYKNMVNFKKDELNNFVDILKRIEIQIEKYIEYGEKRARMK